MSDGVDGFVEALCRGLHGQQRGNEREERSDTIEQGTVSSGSGNDDGGNRCELGKPQRHRAEDPRGHRLGEPLPRPAHGPAERRADRGVERLGEKGVERCFDLMYLLRHVGETVDRALEETP